WEKITQMRGWACRFRLNLNGLIFLAGEDVQHFLQWGAPLLHMQYSLFGFCDSALQITPLMISIDICFYKLPACSNNDGIIQMPNTGYYVRDKVYWRKKVYQRTHGSNDRPQRYVLNVFWRLSYSQVKPEPKHHPILLRLPGLCIVYSPIFPKMIKIVLAFQNLASFLIAFFHPISCLLISHVMHGFFRVDGLLVSASMVERISLY
ncbi:MAG: hypothetical protein PHG11_08210, partial [Eubacteriales bacterium]|nr:hypothetical protein [Eubacteriales bacterium]